MQSIDMEVAMSSTQLITATSSGRELASREIDGTNDWTELAGRQNEGLLGFHRVPQEALKVAVADSRQNEQFEFDVAGADALAAFNHPFAYAGDSLDLQPQS